MTMHISYGMYNISDIHKHEIKELIDKNLSSKMDSYLLPYRQRNALISLIVRIEKNKRNKYDGVIKMLLDGKIFLYRTHGDGFRIVADIVNHAFDRFKEQLSHK